MTSSVSTRIPPGAAHLPVIERGHQATVELLLVGGRICAEDPAPLRSELIRLGLAFATRDIGATCTVFQLGP